MRICESRTWEVWTDGSSQGNRIEWKHGWLCERGGYGAVITRDGEIVAKLYEGFRNTTNNRMELSAVLYALKWFKEPSNIIIYSDSQYIVNSINNGSARKWFQEQDYTKRNLDIWIEILDLIDWHFNVEFRWVKGHAGNKYNELVNDLAQHAANCLNLKEDIKINEKMNSL